MDSNRLAIAALLFIVLIVAINIAMYGIARGATKGSNSRWLSALKDSLSKPMDSKANRSLDELRKQVSDLEKHKRGE